MCGVFIAVLSDDVVELEFEGVNDMFVGVVNGYER